MNQNWNCLDSPAFKMTECWTFKIFCIIKNKGIISLFETISLWIENSFLYSDGVNIFIFERMCNPTKYGFYLYYYYVVDASEEVVLVVVVLLSTKKSYPFYPRTWTKHVTDKQFRVKVINIGWMKSCSQSQNCCVQVRDKNRNIYRCMQ